MGRLRYGPAGEPIGVDDRTLAHLKAVIVTKLRRGEAFTLSWTGPPSGPVATGSGGAGRNTVWLHPAVPLWFEFDSAVAPELSARWIDELAQSAHSTGGIRLVSEPTAASASGGQR